MNKYKIWAFVVLLLASCQSENTNEIPTGVINRDIMVKIMADVHIAESQNAN
ncbi:MAG: hypothetical protein IPL22_15900 [Bacteroidetes bacterium]|nr:hypothetical protein [Bacteroidota bacterium]